jgi:hypothetical protein
MKKLILASLAVIVVLSSCNIGSQFTSRKYTDGFFVSKSHKKDRVEGSKQPSENNQTKANDNDQLLASSETSKKIMPVSNTVINDKDATTEVAPVIEEEKEIAFRKISTPTESKSQVKRSAFSIAPSSLIKLSQNNKLINKIASKSSKKGGGFDVSALLGTIFGVLGVGLASAGYIAFYASPVFFVFFLFALVFGILGLVFGIKGMTNRNGWSSLVFGIIGLVTGIVAMLLSFYYLILVIMNIVNGVVNA